jgi:hypothetical protein
MNVWWNSSNDHVPDVGDSRALALMLDYVVAEAKRLGLHSCAHHAALARDASASKTRETLHS